MASAGSFSQKKPGSAPGDHINTTAGEEPSKALPSFSVDAADDLEDISAGIPADGKTRARLALADALAASQPVVHSNRFSGRRELLASLIAAIEQQRAHVVLYGERGIGKTSLTHIFSDTARAANYLVLYGSCGVEASFDEIFRNFAHQIPLLYHASISPTSDETEHRRTFGDLLSNAPLQPRALSELFAKLVGTRVILILDEYDRVADRNFRRDVAELIKNLSDRAARVQLLLTGVASNLDELIGFTPSIRRNIVGIPVGPMPSDEMLEILRLAENLTGLNFSSEARDLILKMAAGSPYLVRLLGNRAAGLALDAVRMRVSEADVLTGTEAVLSEWNKGLPRRVQAQLALPEVRSSWPTLIAAARASGTPDEWFTALDVALELADGDEQSVREVLDTLSGEIDLFDRQTDQENNPSYRFRTQGLAQLLGLSAALARVGR